MWNAIYASAHLKLSGPGENKALLILSDGHDTGSTHSFAAALDEVRQSGAVVYAVPYQDSLSPDASNDDLRRLTDESGGVLFDLHDTDYSGIVARIAADLRGRYILGFRPDSTEGETRRHSLKVEVLRSGATVALAGNTLVRSQPNFVTTSIVSGYFEALGRGKFCRLSRRIVKRDVVQTYPLEAAQVS